MSYKGRPADKTPRAKHYGTVLLLNRAATKLLTQDRENFVAIMEDPSSGQISLRPLRIAGCSKIVKILLAGANMQQDRIAFQSREPLYPKGARFECQWDDSNQQLVLVPNPSGESSEEKE